MEPEDPYVENGVPDVGIMRVHDQTRLRRIAGYKLIPVLTRELEVLTASKGDRCQTEKCVVELGYSGVASFQRNSGQFRLLAYHDGRLRCA